MADLVGQVGIIWQTEALPLLPDTYIFEKVAGKSLESASAPTSDAIITGQTHGTYGGGPFMPNNVSLAVAHRSNFSGRSANGRSFWPGLPRQTVNNNVVQNSYMVSIISVFDDIMTSCEAKGWTFCILSRVSLKVRRPEGIGYVVASNGFADNVVDSMRRRLPKRGS
jgi:hypothetical protein